MSAFPAEPPATLDDSRVTQEHDWQEFRRLAQMENHWRRPGWTPGRRSYHWMLTTHGADDVQRLAKHCQAELPPIVLDLVPLDALHLTMGRIGFTDQLARATAVAVANEATSRCRNFTAFELTIGPLAGSRGALRFSVAPWSPLIALHGRLASATRHVLGNPCLMDTRRFRPHLSIAYANTGLSVESLLPTLEQLRTLAVATMTVSSVALVELRREGRTYRYDELERIALKRVAST